MVEFALLEGHRYTTVNNGNRALSNILVLSKTV